MTPVEVYVSVLVTATFMIVTVTHHYVKSLLYEFTYREKAAAQLQLLEREDELQERNRD